MGKKTNLIKVGPYSAIFFFSFEIITGSLTPCVIKIFLNSYPNYLLFLP